MKRSIEVLTVLACTAFVVGCSRDARDTGVVNDDTYSGTTTAAPAPVAPATGSAGNTMDARDTTTEGMNTTTTTTTDSTMMSKSARVKKAHGKKHMKKQESTHDTSAIWTDPVSNASYDNDVELDETTSGMTTSQEAGASANGAMPSTSMRAWAFSPFFHEPASRSPVQIGSTQLSGKDGSIASVEANTVFVSPAALQRNINSRIAVQPLNEVDFGRYSYRDRMKFQSQMSARLSNIDSRVEVVKTQAADESQVAAIDQSSDALRADLRNADDVSADRWVSYRESFRDRLANLERDLSQVQVSQR